MVEDEFAIIARYFAGLSGDAVQVVAGPGDDCAVLQVAPGQELCVSTDTLLTGVHFPGQATAEIVATRTVVANLSDLAAMGAAPHAFVLALTMPTADEHWLEEFATTLKSLSDRYGVPLVGGNLSRGALSLTMTVLGQVPDGQAIYRSGAAPGDGVFVTGSPGDAGQGLVLFQQGSSDGYLVSRYTHPTPRLAMGQALRGIASAMIDVSDGLVSDAGHIAERSQVSISLQLEDLPVSAELVASVGRQQALALALAAGDDYELCFTVPADRQAELDRISGELDVPVTRIGTVIAGTGVNVQDASGNIVESKGYRHF